MLPFLKPKALSATIIAKTKPSGEIDTEKIEGEEPEALMIASEDIIKAIHNKDAKALCEAIRAAFDIMDSEPMMEEESQIEDEE